MDAGSIDRATTATGTAVNMIRILHVDCVAGELFATMPVAGHTASRQG